MKAGRPAAQGRRTRTPLPAARLNELWQAVWGEDPQAALSELCALAKSERVKKDLNARKERPDLRALLADPRPKVRKNAARLLGALYLPGDQSALQEAIEHEDTLYVLPSLLLALGQGAAAAGPFLREFAQKRAPSSRPEDAKHEAAIASALSAALSRADERPPLPFLGFSAPHDALLTVHRGCEALLLDEAKERGIALERHPLGFFQKDADCAALFSLRCFSELLLPALPGSRQTPGPAAALLAARPVLCECLGEAEFYRYRLEVRAGRPEERQALRRSLLERLAPLTFLKNSPSAYDFELRCEAQDPPQLFLRFPGADRRFAYRKAAVPASIDPAVAAALVRFAKPFAKENARVLDPCCGSGTLLLERASASPCAALVGVDVDGQAVLAARQNFAAAGVVGRILHQDALRFSPAAPFDELYANLPFGTRVGSREGNDRFYAGLFARMDHLLAPNGFALCYTTQKAVLLRAARKNGFFPAAELRLEAGGLSPWAVVLRRKKGAGAR